jgi:hypothetical protein
VDQDELLRYVARACEAVGLRYFVTGSMATILYGSPRFTNDIDVVIDLTRDRIADFLNQFPAERFYSDEETIRRAVDRKSQFNVIHPASGLKIGFMIPSGDAFDRSRFARTRTLPAGAEEKAVFASPEDVIVKKMHYFQEGGSERHLQDIAGVLELGGDRIDRDYIGEWAGRLGLHDIWARIVRSLEK